MTHTGSHSAQRRSSQPSRRVRALLIGLALALGLFALLEGGLQTLHAREGDLREQTESYTEYDPELGYRGRSQARARSRLEFGGQVIWDVEYQLDQDGWRTTPFELTSERTEYALFLGDSFTFGIGLAPHETLPAAFARHATNAVPYNRAIGGWGPQHLLGIVDDPRTLEGVAETSGWVIYSAIDAHIERAVGAARIVLGQGHSFPYYVAGANGELEHRGNFRDDRRWVTRFYRLAASCQTLRLFDIALPRMGAGEHELAARLILAAEREYSERLPGSRFVVLAWPGEAAIAALLPRLQEAGVTCLDYSRLTDPPFGERYPHDRHPTPAAVDALAARLARDLTRME